MDMLSLNNVNKGMSTMKNNCKICDHNEEMKEYNRVNFPHLIGVVDLNINHNNHHYETSHVCQICDQHKTNHKDFRFLDDESNDLKIWICTWCQTLSDDARQDIIESGSNWRHPKKIDPREYYAQNWRS
ncbi:MAG: hypothetical protein Unbinned400contig1004_28 [Prokaryotic dsDNA virus sp.]|nr:MAG: hypothetical protein Unbinned400contig1004_28 [Prokaryotic dsDNA virus sp.]